MLRALGQKLCSRVKVINWWIGDWWASGQHRYGERAKAAAQGIFGREFGSLANSASVARSFGTSRRREALSYSHHVEVAHSRRRRLIPSLTARRLRGGVAYCKA